jgi:hypothetical protein
MPANKYKTTNGVWHLSAVVVALNQQQARVTAPVVQDCPDLQGGVFLQGGSERTPAE